MEMGENWHINAPWAQLVATTKMPDELFQTTLELTDKIYEDVNRDSAGESLAGQIDNEYFISQEKLLESGLMDYFIEMTIKYWGTVLTNGNMWAYLDNKIEHWLNGTKILEYIYGSDAMWDLVAKSKFSSMPLFAKATEGQIGLQGDHGEIWYRNIRIRKL